MRREARPSLFKSNQQAPITGLLSVVTQDTNTNASTKRAHARYNVEGIAEGGREREGERERRCTLCISCARGYPERACVRAHGGETLEDRAMRKRHCVIEKLIFFSMIVAVLFFTIYSRDVIWKTVLSIFSSRGVR